MLYVLDAGSAIYLNMVFQLFFFFGVTVFTLNKHLLVPLLQELNQRLLAAARGGRTEEVEALLCQGAYIECTDEVRHV